MGNFHSFAKNKTQKKRNFIIIILSFGVVAMRVRVCWGG